MRHPVHELFLKIYFVLSRLQLQRDKMLIINIISLLFVTQYFLLIFLFVFLFTREKEVIYNYDY